MARKKKTTSIPAPLHMPHFQSAHLEGHTAAPKLHIGQKATARLHGTIKSISQGEGGRGHRITIEPEHISYMGHKSKPESKVAGVRVVKEIKNKTRRYK